LFIRGTGAFRNIEQGFGLVNQVLALDSLFLCDTLFLCDFFLNENHVMDAIRRIKVDNFEFEMGKNQVSVSPAPPPETPSRHYPSFIPIERKDVAPVCFAIASCWRQPDFLDRLASRKGGGSQSVTSYDFYNPNEFEESPPAVRVNLEPGERGVVCGYLEEDVETSEQFFAKLVIAFGTYCVENEMGFGHTKEDLDRIREAFLAD
jgi:hypothetical protein